MSQSNQRHEPWRAKERHYCAVCNTWMGSDRQSILIHENGKKHKENVEANLIKRREAKAQEEKDKNSIQSALKKMEEAAANSVLGQCRIANNATSTMQMQQQQVVNIDAEKKEMDAWKERKKKKEEGSEEKEQNEKKNGRKRRKLGPDEGHYTLGTKTYLEGSIYAPIFEEDMIVQVWTGSSTMSSEYKKSAEAQSLWKNGIILKVQKTRKTLTQKAEDENDDEEYVIRCHVTYLKNMNDEDETIEKNVDGARLRLILGVDEFTPGTIEEARLSLAGGEEVTTMENNNNGSMTGANNVDIDENTGLSGWGTVSVRKVAVSHQVKEERERIRAKKREAAEKEKMKAKEAEGRMMEEAKHANADDSALGAYDVWSTSGKSGYKGVHINANAKLSVTDTAKSLSKGKTGVQFKKRKGTSAFKKSRKKQNRRTTSGGDDDDE